MKGNRHVARVLAGFERHRPAPVPREPGPQNRSDRVAIYPIRGGWQAPAFREKRDRFHICGSDGSQPGGRDPRSPPGGYRAPIGHLSLSSSPG
jgi:hypothetical protein